MKESPSMNDIDPKGSVQVEERSSMVKRIKDRIEKKCLPLK